MELRQLQHFSAVAQFCNFTRAAAELQVVQSTLSASIRKLERELGASLFERTTRRVSLTPAGRALLPTALRMLRDAELARNTVRSVASVVEGEVALGTIQALTWVDLPKALGWFRREHPKVEVTLHEAPVDELIENLLQGKLDLAYVARDPKPLSDGVVVHATHDEDLTLVVPPNHPLIGQSGVQLGDLADESFIDFRAGRGLDRTVATYCTEANLNRKVAVSATQLHLVNDLVAEGLGIAIVPDALARRGELPRVTIEPRPRRTVALIGRERRPSNPAALALLNVLQAKND